MMPEIPNRDDELFEGELVVDTLTRRAAVVQRAQALAPVAKAAAVATVGAAAGAVTAVVVAKVSQQPQRRLQSRRRGERMPAIESTTSILIDIHRLAER